MFDYRALSNQLFEIANRRYTGKQRKRDTFQITLQADGVIPYNTIASAMAGLSRVADSNSTAGRSRTAT